MKEKFSTHEPATRPFTVTLSPAELVAVLNWHISVCKGMPKKLGAHYLKPRFILAPARDIKAIIKAAQDQINAHSDRVKELQQVFKSHSNIEQTPPNDNNPNTP